MMFALNRPIMLQLAALRADVRSGMAGASISITNALSRRSEALRALAGAPLKGALHGSFDAVETGSTGFNDPVEQWTFHVDAHQSGEAAARRVS